MYVFVAQSPALLVADAPSSPLAEILNLDKQLLEPTTNKPANPVTANLPVLVTEEFTTYYFYKNRSKYQRTGLTYFPAQYAFVAHQDSSFFPMYFSLGRLWRN
jgi:hypothetical protein